MVAFINLKGKEKILGRLYIEVYTSYDINKIFIKMLTGESGISHKYSSNFNLIEYNYEDVNYRVLQVGYFDVKARQIFSNLFEGNKSIRSSEKLKTGDLFVVNNYYSNISHLTRFSISLNDNDYANYTVIGKVFAGYDVLEDAINKENYEDLSISDCGLIVSESNEL